MTPVPVPAGPPADTASATGPARTGWPAPTVDAPVRGTVSAPGSKSVTSRALLLAALSGGDCTVDGVPASRDTALMTGALAALGVPVESGERSAGGTSIGTERSAGGTSIGTERSAGGTSIGTAEQVRIGAHDGFRGGDAGAPATVDCGLAGTVMRFVPPAAALARGSVRFDGDPHARERPMATVLGALRDLGATITVEGDRAALPFLLQGNGCVRGGTVRIDASASSQFVSGLLLSGAGYDEGVTIRHHGPPVPSQPHIDMTVTMLRAAGVTVEDRSTGTDPDTWRVHPGPVAVRDWAVEPDLSNAAVFLAAAAATGGTVTVSGWPEETTQPGTEILPVLAQFGARVETGPGGLTVTGPDHLDGVDVDLHEASELAPTVAALAALARGTSRIRGIAHIRGHETDRIAALATEITALGGAVTETEDGLEITPRPLAGRPDRAWRAYADHRMATAGAIVGLRVPGVVVDDIGCTDKTIPDFPGRWAALLAG